MRSSVIIFEDRHPNFMPNYLPCIISRISIVSKSILNSFTRNRPFSWNCVISRNPVASSTGVMIWADLLSVRINIYKLRVCQHRLASDAACRGAGRGKVRAGSLSCSNQILILIMFPHNYPCYDLSPNYFPIIIFPNLKLNMFSGSEY